MATLMSIDDSAVEGASPGPSAYQAALMSEHVYNASDKPGLDGWQPEGSRETGSLGFAAATYRRGNYRVVAYQGTNNPADAMVDASMVPQVPPHVAYAVIQDLLQRYGVQADSKKSMVTAGMVAAIFKCPGVGFSVRRWANRTPASQSGAALKYFDRYRGDVQMVVGHSLGGALAQKVSMDRDVSSVAFNSPYMGDLRGTSPSTSILNLCVNTIGDPLSCATRGAGNLPHGQVVEVSIKPFSGHVPTRRPMGYSGWAAVMGLIIDPLPSDKIMAVSMIGGAATVYSAEFVAFVVAIALHYHSMQNLRIAMVGQPRLNRPIRPNFQGF